MLSATRSSRGSWSPTTTSWSAISAKSRSRSASSSTRSPPASPAPFVFKTIVDPYVGRVNLFKVIQGTVKPDVVLTNGRSLADERLHQLTTMRGKEQISLSELPPGDIGAVAK